MFQNSRYKAKQDKICSISNFSSQSSSINQNQWRMTVRAKDTIKESESDIENKRFRPIFIISPDFNSKHIIALTKVLEKNNVPVQFQHETNSLGLELNTNFFVVTDNKSGTLKLGPEFNSQLMTIVGYPKTGSNKKNIYCQQPEKVLEEYKQFIGFKNKPVQAQNPSQKRSKLHVQQSMFRSGSNASSIINSELSGIKLRSISKYKPSRFQESKQLKPSASKSLNNGIFKSQTLQKKGNRQNLTLNRQIHSINKNPHNLYFMQSYQSQPYNSLVSKLYHSLKTLDQKRQQQMIYYYKCQKDLLYKLNDAQLGFADKSLKSIYNEKKQHFIVLSSQVALKLAIRVNSQFYTIRNKINFIVVILPKQSQPYNNVYQKDLLVIKKALKSNLFQYVVCSAEQCQKALKDAGFTLKTEKSIMKANIQQKHQTQGKILSKSTKKLLWAQGIKDHQVTDKAQDIVSFCSPRKEQSSKGQQKNQIENRKMLLEQKPMKQNQFLTQTHQSLINELNQFQISNIVIPPISSMSSRGNSQISSSTSKSKLIRLIKKQPQNCILSNRQQRNRNISQVNSEYCINKNKQTIQKLQSKLICSKLSMSSSKRSINSSQENSNQQQQITIKVSRLSLSENLPLSRQKVGSGKFSNRKQLKDRERHGQNQVVNEYQYFRPQLQKAKKVKMNNISTIQPFMARCSQIQLPDEGQMTMSLQKQKINLSRNNKFKKTSVSAPTSTDDYYFGTSLAPQRKWQQRSSLAKDNLIDGLVYIQYNQMVTFIVNQFKERCPQSVILKDKYKHFYLSRQYSKQVNKIWGKGKQRNILPVLVDIQGLGQIHKYYSNVMYEDDQLQFLSSISQNNYEQKQKYMQNTGNFTNSPNKASESPILLLFFTILTVKQSQNQIFEQFDKISLRLPQHQIIKCVVQQDLSDNQMKEKSLTIYNQMFQYFEELKQQYGDRFVETR